MTTLRRTIPSPIRRTLLAAFVAIRRGLVLGLATFAIVFGAATLLRTTVSDLHLAAILKRAEFMISIQKPTATIPMTTHDGRHIAQTAFDIAINGAVRARVTQTSRVLAQTALASSVIAWFAFLLGLASGLTRLRDIVRRGGDA